MSDEIVRIEIRKSRDELFKLLIVSFYLERRKGRKKSCCYLIVLESFLTSVNRLVSRGTYLDGNF